jgi:hypothetical protein
MNTYNITFKSTLPDEFKFDAKGNVVEPAGRAHAELLARALRNTELTNVSEPWNEEDYAWEFIGELNGVAISVIVGEDFDTETQDGRMLVYVHAFCLKAWLFRVRARNAVAVAAEIISKVLGSDPRMSDIRILSEMEYQANAKVQAPHR